MRKIFPIIITITLISNLFSIKVIAQQLNLVDHQILTPDEIKVGAQQFSDYLPLLNNKKVGIITNQTSMVSSSTHLVDSLLALNVSIQCIFSPEHGFRGNIDAGKSIKDGIDPTTNLPVYSLYGKNKKPKSEWLNNLDIVLFDLQDVGVRFYTYISTLHYVMEACAEHSIQVIILDRPNPNGHFVDGPILEEKYKSFVGMHKIPVVHGMTIGEYAQMINGEGWLPRGLNCQLKVIKVSGYDHSKYYQLPVKPSPNLPNMASVYLYPSLCFFEGSVYSVGRGTNMPFQCFGHPNFKGGDLVFVPKSTPGAALKPKLMGDTCYGFNLKAFGENYILKMNKLYLFWLMEAYRMHPDKDAFFNNFFDKLAGTNKLRKMIIAGKTEKEIRASWQKDLNEFKMKRKIYLLYPDFY